MNMEGANAKSMIMALQDKVRYHQRPILWSISSSLLMALSSLVLKAILLYGYFGSTLLLGLMTFFSPIFMTALIFVASVAILTPLFIVLRNFKLNFGYKRSERQNPSQILGAVLVAPHTLDQGGRNICGMASLVSLFLHNDPHRLAQMVDELTKNGHTLGESHLNLLSNPGIRSLHTNKIDYLLCAMRYTSNITGYKAVNVSGMVDKRLEKFRGVTRPKRIAAFMIEWGYTNVVDTTKIIDGKGKEISWIRRLLLGGCYFHAHKNFSTPSEHFEYACQRINKIENPAVMLMSVQLCIQILFGENINIPLITTLGCTVDHFVYVNYLEAHGDKVTIRIHTWGKEAVRTIPRELFIQGFRGIIVGEKLSNSPGQGATGAASFAPQLLPRMPASASSQVRPSDTPPLAPLEHGNMILQFLFSIFGKQQTKKLSLLVMRICQLFQIVTAAQSESPRHDSTGVTTERFQGQLSVPVRFIRAAGETYLDLDRRGEVLAERESMLCYAVD